VIDGFGTCTPVPAADIFSGMTCTTPTNYPGALQVNQGTPNSVLTQLGQMVPAQGLFSIYTEALDYFYADFLQQTDNYVQIKWLQPGNYTLVMSIRERVGGTAWNNLTWNDNETTDFIGGHQSCCGEILASDTISFPVLRDLEKAVCENVSWDFGRPNYTFNAPVNGVYPNVSYDTMIVFGEMKGTAGCEFFETDSLYNVDFFVRHTPVVTVKNDTLCRCETLANVLSLVTVDNVGLNDTQSSYELQWYYKVGTKYTWNTTPSYYSRVVNANGDTVYTYTVRQVNTYDDTLDCVGPQASFTVVYKEMLAPTIATPALVDFCREALTGATLALTANLQDTCGKTVKWYTKMTGNDGGLNYQWLLPPYSRRNTSDLNKNTLLFTGKNLSVNLADYMPSTNKDTVIYFFATAYDDQEGCESPKFDYVAVTIHQTPELQASVIKDVYCPGSEVEMKVSIKNNPDLTEPPYIYKWMGDVTEVLLNGARVPATGAQEKLVGTGTNNYSYLPLYSYNKRSYTQQIFTPSEIGATGEISKIAFQNATAGTNAGYVRNVKVYLALSDEDHFSTNATYGKEWCTEGMQLVYEGNLDCRKALQEWLEVPFTTPYTYDGSKNLVVVVQDLSSSYVSGVQFKSMSKDGASMYATNDNLNTNPENISKSARTVTNNRNNIKFFVESINTTNAKNQTAYNQTNITDPCGKVYTTQAYVVDGNGCKSDTVTFTYKTNDTIAPVVTPNAMTTRVKGCKVNSTNSYTFANNVAAFTAAGINVHDDAIADPDYDNCGLPFVTVAKTAEYHYAGDCEDTVVRVYTFTDKCNNTATFTHTFIARDSTAPSFAKADGSFPYVRLFPVEGGNCTFNSPDSMEFVNAVAPFVHDDCTDSAYLMSTLVFNWENITESPIGATNIFREKNHLTVEATITDKCGNSTKGLIIYLDRPEKLSIKPNGITSTGNQCFGDTATLTFDPAFIADDTIMGPFVPYTYAWSEVNGRTVTFTAANATETQILFPEAGDYTFVITVTDRNGCTAVSEPVTLNVRALPVMTINHIVLNGQTEPYCPTYGNLTVEAQIVNPVAGQTIAPHAYTWTGESVNVMSDSSRTWVTIVPEWCDTLYYPTVTVVDDRGCVGSVTDTIEVKAQGPQVTNLPDTTVEKMAGCVFRIPDFKPLIDASIVDDDCYTFSQLKYSDAFATIERTDWYSQSPVAGTIFTEDTKVVTITIKNPCGKTATLNVNVLKPADVLTVSINPTTAADCQAEIENVGVDYTATVENAFGSVDYTWSLVGSSTTLTNNHNAVYHAQGAMEPGTYTYRVSVEDALNCTASTTANLTVYFQGADPYVRTWPNTLCVRYNGALAVDTAPRGYAYTLEHQVYGNPQTKISDVPAHMPTDWTTIVFDSLRPGYYNLTVYTTDGCERTHVVFIDEASAAPAAPTFNTTDVTVCTNDNGILNINAVAGFTYQLYHYDGNVLGDLVGTATSYNNLSVGKYLIHSIQNSTKCEKDTTFTLIDNAPRPTVTTNVTANSNCANTSYNNNPENVFNGQIKITSSTSLKYTVYTSSNDTLLDGVTLTSTNNPIKNLAPATYYITAYNPATGCSTLTPKAVTVGTSTTTPTISTSKTPNHYCAVDTADGSITVTNYSNFRSLGLLKKIAFMTYDTITYRTNQHSWSSLYDNDYMIEAIGNNYCRATLGVTVTKSTVLPNITATSTMNPSCVKDLGAITLKTTNASTMNVSTYGNAHIAYYKIQKGTFEKDSTTTLNQVTFNNVASGTYNWTAKTQYGCSKTGTVEVEQYQLPAMQLDSTPNHMCAPTFEKPGDGTVTVVVPTTDNVPGNHFFEYYFYDEADVNMEVPYELPLTNTKYWLAAKRYHVVAVDTITGCTVDGYITVENDFYTVDFDYTTTPNYICGTSPVGNGTITVVNPTSTNPDPVFQYSIDGVNYTSNPVFTGLKDGNYTIYVKDTTMACVAFKAVPVNPTDSCAPEITICDNVDPVNPTCGTQFDYCYGEAGIQLCATVNDTCNPTNVYTYAWYAPCADPSTSNTSCIDVQTDHYVVNGCDYIFTATNTATGCNYSKTVNVAIHPNPALSFKINGVVADIEHSNPFCENQELHIELVSTHELDTTSIEWTLPTFIAGTGFADFYIKGDTVATDNVTFCVRANSKYGCPSPIASLPVTFKRIAHVTVPMVACDGTCIINNPDGSTTNITKPASETYPYTTTVVRTYTSVLTGCDSVVTYNITLIAAPEFTATPTVAPFCEDENKTLADYEAGYAVTWNDVDPGTLKWMAAAGTGTYTKVSAIADVTAGDYVITNAAGTKAMLCTTVGSALNQDNANTSSPAANMVWQLVKNSDNTYSIYSPTINKYVGGLTSNGVQLLDANTAPNAKWNISFNGSNVEVKNVQHSYRYLKYNTSSPRFACYDYGTSNTAWLALYKSDAGTYEEVPSTTALTYDYVTTHSIKRVAHNGCGDDEEAINFEVYKKPAINTFNLSNPYCASQEYNFTANVSTYGTPATAKLYIQGNTTPLATVTVNGLNQTVTFNNIKTPWSYNGKNLTLEVKNANDFCDAVTSVKQITVDTSYIDGLANSNIYCVGDQMTLADFTGIVPTNYSTIQVKQMVGTVAAPSTDPTITLPYTFTDRTMNGKKVYVQASNSCFTSIVSNAVTLTVNDKPTVATIANIDVCAEAFSLVAPTVTNNGSAIIAAQTGWLLKGTSGYAASTVDAIKNAARDHVVNAAYYATNSCGSDTVKFTVLVNDKPQVTLSAATMCPNANVSSAITTSVNFHNINGIAGVDNKAYFVAKKTGVRDVINVATATFASIATYNSLWYIAENPCGADSAQVTINVLTNTYTAPVYQPACAGEQLSAFVATAPTWTGTASTTSYTWQVKTGSNWTDATTSTVITVPAPEVRYKWVTECGDVITTTPTTLTVNQKPELTLKNVAAVCAGANIDPTTAIQSVTYHGNEDKYDTTYTVNGAVITSTTTIDNSYNNKYLVVTLTDNNQACGEVKDSVKLTVNPLPTPTITGPEKTCKNVPVTITANTGYNNYAFYLNNETTPVKDGPDNDYDFPATMTGTGVEFTTINVTVTDANGCLGSSAQGVTVKVTDMPQFIFYNPDLVNENTSHEYTVDNTAGLTYAWEVSTQCNYDDPLVYVEYDIYYNGQILTNLNIGQYLSTVTTLDMYGNTNHYVTTNTFSWLNGDQSQHTPVTSLYNFAVADPTNSVNGNHFPNTNLGLTNTNVYDDLWMHFLGDRKVTASVVPFRLQGDYKIVYRLYSTSHADDFNHLYYEDRDHMGGAYLGQKLHLGGQDAFVGNPTITLLAIDSITIHYTGPNQVASSDPVVENTPEVAPSLNIEESQVLPEMEVWPNPAPAVTTTLKARVHNMNGDATVTLTSLTGKQVYNGNIFIDNDNYYFEFDVNSLSVGSYIMTVRTATDVITKKVIVTTLAR
jgi:hypothetical protein